jgi:chaperonin GroES
MEQRLLILRTNDINMPCEGLKFERRDCIMALRPLGDRILVNRNEDKEQKSPGGIIIPDTAKEKPQRGIVAAVGKGALNEKGERIPMEVKAGDQVLFGKYAGNEVKNDGEEYLILKESEVLGIIE